jgi:hypothetical protein
MKNKQLLFLMLLIPFLSKAQSDSASKWRFSGYGEFYYSYDFAQPLNNEKESFIYNHKRHNEINANLIIAKAQFNDKHIRGTLALMAGTYAQYNLAKEPTWAQFMNEANVGMSLSKNNRIWLDIGIMPSHIGFESAISADCWTLTRSILAENSPYYESGLKLSSSNKSKNLNLSFLFLNGWQKIERPSYSQRPSFGMQINYKPNKLLMLNYSNFIGTDSPDSLRAWRTYHNLYAQYEGKRKLGFIAGFDLGTDKYTINDYGLWLAPVLIVRYTLDQKSKIAVRGEYYQDQHQIIIQSPRSNGVRISCLSVNYDYRINQNMLWRIEGKVYDAKHPIFSQDKERQNYSLTTNLTVQF